MSYKFLLTSPNSIGLPAAERGDAVASVTRAVVDEHWPQIERLLGEGQPAEAISLMEALAMEMRRATAGDSPVFRDALTLARRVLYDDLAQVGRSTEYEGLARSTLNRCAVWDEDLKLYLTALVVELMTHDD